ncbi:citramalate synthase [Sneathiella sp. P13V-1]|uniref:citramalate synthase n=1 Tax=Sneathiella sp. P13V-1 TaxID=2697366 RepID=UPI00187BA043|nr:citramalate synthase [Sneathiella sp. P13V-1]MBE7637136.1 citramalate synthase [Sneathiella sp. P13V-1]
MAKERLYLFDTTLRDGAQTQGVDFSVEDKIIIAETLDRLGIDYIEGGWPGANPGDTAFFDKKPKFKNATFTAFGMTRRPGRSASNDSGLKAVLDAETPAVCLVGKSWDFQVKVALGIELDENVDLIASSIEECKRLGREPMYDAEHFFDGYKANPEYALKCAKAAYEAGARWVVLCDTNGGALPHEVEEIVSEVVKHIPGDHLGIHTHNDTENAVANSLAAILAGVRQVQGTLNGLGERCGNANMVSLIPSLMLKEPFKSKFDIGISKEGLKGLLGASRLLDEILNRTPNRHQAYVGASAFTHKGGLHVSAVQKDPSTYEHVDPALVGNKRVIPVSNQAGRSNLIAQFEGFGLEIDPKDPKVDRLLDEVKEREFNGYSYDGAPASFELMARRRLGQVPKYFEVESFRVQVERRHNAKGDLISVSDAVVKVIVDGERLMSVAEGNGPVNALDGALRKDLGKYSEYLQDLRLVDFKVRILSRGTEAITRVLIESTDDSGDSWITVGVSPNIVDASFAALIDSINYKLLRDGAPAGT